MTAYRNCLCRLLAGTCGVLVLGVWAHAQPPVEPTPIAPSLLGKPGAEPGGLPNCGPASNSLPNEVSDSFFDEPCCGLSLASSISVDFLILRRAYTHRDLAFNSNVSIPGIGGPGPIFFDNQTQTTPRVTLRIMGHDDWGVSGSWYRNSQSNQSLGFVNSDPNRLVTSAILPFGPGSVASTITGGNSNTPPTVTVPVNNFVASQSPFYYLPLLPTHTLFDDPDKGGNNQGNVIKQKFEYTSNVAAGFPDSFSVQSQFRMETADLLIIKSWDAGKFLGGAGFGLQYAYFAHSFRADRFNTGGPLPTKYDPQDGDSDLNSIDPKSRFQDGPDFDHYMYTQSFTGLGPKLSIETNWCPTEAIQFYSRTAGSIVMGTRTETVSISSVQNGSFINRDSAAEITDFNGGILTFSRTVNGDFVRRHFIFMPAAEAEVGVAFHLGSRPGIDPVLRLGAVAQYWSFAGNSTNPRAGLFLYGGVVSLGFEF